MQKLGIVGLILLLGALTTPRQMRAQDLVGGKERLRALITSGLGGATRLPSMAVAVVHGDSIVWEEGFGWANQERRIAATPTTPYYLASVTKVFTGTALALLASERKVDMNRPVNAYLGSHKVRPALWDESAITVERIADHIAGLTTFNLDCDSAGPCRLDTVIDRFGVIVRPPGENFDYSNLGYGILGEVIARTSKQSYGEFLRSAVFEPLGMRDCEVAADGRPRRAAVPYVVGTTRAVATSYSATPAASGAFCSAHSLALFGRALLNSRPGASPDAGSSRWAALLPSSGVPAVQTGTPSGTTYSRGWWIEEDYVGMRSILASGGTPYASAILRLVPAEQLAVVVLANMGADVVRVADAVLDELVPAIRERRKNWTPPAPATRQRRPISPELVGTWAGAIDTYRGKRSLTLSIDSSGEVTGALAGAKAEVRLTGGGASGPRVFGRLPDADLGIEEARPGSYDLQLGLAMYGSRLAGFATTAARPDSSAPALTFLVELTRR
jgi:CubicO group peptidase (beta-lactamase class C family)